MAENTDIFDGTVSVTTGTKAVTGVGTLWLSAGIQAGDMFGSDGYSRARIDTVNSNTSITLKDNWRGPTLAAGSTYWIRYQADSSRYSTLLGQVRKMLSQASVAALSALTGAANKLPFFTSDTTMDMVNFFPWAQSFIGAASLDAALPNRLSEQAALITDFNAIAASGFYRTAGTAANQPVAASLNCLHIQFTAGNSTQLAWRISSSDGFARQCSGGVWSSWVSTTSFSDAQLPQTMTGKLFTGQVNFVVANANHAVTGTVGAAVRTDGSITACVSNAPALFLSRATAGGAVISFYSGSNPAGNISNSGTTTSYNATSDYRTKSNIRDLTNSGVFIDALKPRRFEKDGLDQGGFVAHEFQEVSPMSVQGEKDAMENIGTVKDGDGLVYAENVPQPETPPDYTWEKTGTRPVFQSMQASTSEVMAMVISQLQELRKRVAELEEQGSK